jgi:glycosyltransferase involved in cell wall biosynthesis
MRVIAIIAAFNEADILGPVLEHLISEGVSVYVIDNHSTDRTRAIAETFHGRGLVGIEIFPGDPSVEDGRLLRWRAILERKQQLASELHADWFIHHDADEFRESPWADLRIADAIARVDAAGYNAIDFELLNFRPTNDAFVSGADPRPVITMYQRGDDWDKCQVKCWKKTNSRVDLVSSGGHDASFENRRVFPVRFLLRHYPIRSQSHGERKVFLERRARLDPAERALGWHVQYDGIDERHDFVLPADRLLSYDADRVRLDLVVRHRIVEELETSLVHARMRLADAARAAGGKDVSADAPERADIGAIIRWAIEQREQQLIASAERLASTSALHAAERVRLETEIVHLQTETAMLTNELKGTRLAYDTLGQHLAEESARRSEADDYCDRLLAWARDLEKGRSDLHRQLVSVHESITWRWTAPIRTLVGWLMRLTRW